MKLPFTSVVSYHTNPMTCGVAKFGKQLADRIGVPFVGLPELRSYGRFPLLSLKDSEMGQYEDIVADDVSRYGVFWHDAGRACVTGGASVVFYADPSLGSPGLWCPSLIQPRKRPVRLFSFGMAHKIQTEKYRRVRELLDAAGESCHLRVSIGLHEGTSLDGVEKHFDALKEIMGPENVTILGILSDDAVSEELSNTDYVLAFFEKGLRSNNTTVHAAHLHGRRVISNFDESSPKPLCAHIIDIARLYTWPSGDHQQYLYSWERLLQEMEQVCEASRSTATR